MGGTLPLRGLRVLDLASFIAGPVATTVMGDYGAEVIKSELAAILDPVFGEAEIAQLRKTGAVA